MPMFSSRNLFMATLATLLSLSAGQVFRTFYPIPGGDWTEERGGLPFNRENDHFTRGLGIAMGTEPGENGWPVKYSDDEIVAWLEKFPGVIHKVISELGYPFLEGGTFSDGVYDQGEAYMCQALTSIIYRPQYFHFMGKEMMSDDYLLRHIDILLMGMTELGGGLPKDSVALCIDRMREMIDVPKGQQGACITWADGIPSSFFLRRESFSEKSNLFKLELLRDGQTSDKVWKGPGAGSFNPRDPAWASNIRAPDGSATFGCNAPGLQDGWGSAQGLGSGPPANPDAPAVETVPETAPEPIEEAPEPAPEMEPVTDEDVIASEPVMTDAEEPAEVPEPETAPPTFASFFEPAEPDTEDPAPSPRFTSKVGKQGKTGKFGKYGKFGKAPEEQPTATIEIGIDPSLAPEEVLSDPSLEDAPVPVAEPVSVEVPAVEADVVASAECVFGEWLQGYISQFKK